MLPVRIISPAYRTVLIIVVRNGTDGCPKKMTNLVDEVSTLRRHMAAHHEVCFVSTNAHILNQGLTECVQEMGETQQLRLNVTEGCAGTPEIAGRNQSSTISSGRPFQTGAPRGQASSLCRQLVS